MPKPPFTKDKMFDELRFVVQTMANHVAQYGRFDAAELLTGFATDSLYPYAEDDPSRFDLSRFNITGFMDVAYDYAFQVGQPSQFGDDIAQEINEFRQSANMRLTNGDPSPMANPDSLCRIVVDMAFARWLLEQGSDLTVHELALLAAMKETAVRNSLSAEYIKVETGRGPGEPGTIDGTVAYGWLRKRRGFTDSSDPELRAESRRGEYRALFREKSLNYAMKEALEEAKLTSVDLVNKAGVDPTFVAALIDGAPPLDIEASRRVGKVLDLDVPNFVGVVVEAVLRHE